MQVSVENTGGLERRVKIEVPEEKVTSEISNRLQRLTRTTKVKGFRPGKVPLKVIKSRYGARIRKEVVGELMQSSLYEAINQEKLRPAGSPMIEEIADNKGKPLAFTAVIEIYPDVEIKPVSELNIERPVCNVSADEVASMIEVLRKQQKGLKVVERAAEEGDTVNINFAGFLDSEQFEGGKAENYSLELGSGSFIDGFESGLIGLVSGDEKTLPLQFPGDYSNEKLKGRAVEFKVSINSVNESVLPELDGEFMQRFGVTDGKLETFQEEIRRNMEREVEHTIYRQLKHTILEAIYESHTVELPKSMVKQEEERMRQEIKENMKRQGLDASAMVSTNSVLFTEQAEKRVGLQLMVAEIIKQNQLKVDQAKIRQMIEKMAAGYEDRNAVVNWYYSDQKNLSQVEALALEDEVIAYVLSNANVTEKAVAFDEIMNKGQTAN